MNRKTFSLLFWRPLMMTGAKRGEERREREAGVPAFRGLTATWIFYFQLSFYFQTFNFHSLIPPKTIWATPEQPTTHPPEQTINDTTIS